MTAPPGRPESPWERLEWVEPAEDRRPWEPPSAPSLATAGVSYVVVDEIVGDAAGLAVSPWPSADAEGRLRFPDRGRARMLGTSAAALRDWVDEHRGTGRLSHRRIAIGDVFAAVVPHDAGDGPPEQLLQPPIADITADAREAAKIAFFGAVTEPLAPHEMSRWMDSRDQDDEPPTATGTPLPVPR